MNTPVVLFAYNRLEPLERVLERVLASNPSVLILVADGPRASQESDRAKCHQVRACLDDVHIDGTVHRLYSDVNLGAGRRIASGLDWVFDRFESAIILEDDLLPDPTFFPFCEELLDRYREDPQIAMISGCNFQFGQQRGPHSYFFASTVGTWGWATWRRAWRHYDFEMSRWNEFRSTRWLPDLWTRPEPASYWRDRFDETVGGRDDVWDYQWAFAMWAHGGLEVYPNRNLISHIGCSQDGTHHLDPNHPGCNQPMQPMHFPLSHPPQVLRHLEADLYEFHHLFQAFPDEELVSTYGPSKIARG